jgi:RNA recognition motif-containing protein
VNIFVGNLAFSATDHALRQLFEQYGVVDKINIITDRDTGRSKGFGFVEMPESQAAKTARSSMAVPSRSTKPSRVNRVVSSAAPAGKPARTGSALR